MGESVTSKMIVRSSIVVSFHETLLLLTSIVLAVLVIAYKLTQTHKVFKVTYI